MTGDQPRRNLATFFAAVLALQCNLTRLRPETWGQIARCEVDRALGNGT